MVKKLKGIKIAKDALMKFKFNAEGESEFGSSAEDVHTLIGDTGVTDLNLIGQVTLEERVSDALFGVPQLAGDSNTTELQHLKDNAADYDGYIVYLTTPSTVAPFVDDQKFYFCEAGAWHPSPFTVEQGAVGQPTPEDTDGDGVLDTEDPFTVETPSPGVTHTVLNLTSFDFDNDPIFEQDDSGNILITAAAAGETNGNFEIDADGNIVLIA